jgi:hypothetical protein
MTTQTPALIDPSNGAPPAPVAPVAPIAPAPVPVLQGTPPGMITMTQEAFNDRIAQAQRGVLGRVGFQTEEEARAAKTRLDGLAATEQLAASAGTMRQRLDAYADAQLARLTPEQRAAVEKITAGDKTLALATIDALAPTWAAQPAAIATAPVVASAAPAAPAAPVVPAAAPPAAPPAQALAAQLPPPATTIAAAPPPPPAGVVVTTDHKAVYESKLKSNPYEASMYLLQHSDEIHKK